MSMAVQVQRRDVEVSARAGETIDVDMSHAEAAMGLALAVVG